MLIDGNFKKSPWVTAEDIAAKGALIIGNNEPDARSLLPQQAKRVIDVGALALAPSVDCDLPSKAFYMFIVPPENP
ncbi:MAG: hypothetical protein HKP58_10345 [Desulfatitalea sp.]|nr:hypothetical protein [Desulfatitalea sp.]